MMNMAKVGDLILDREHGDIGLVVEESRAEGWKGLRYRVLHVAADGRRITGWFSREYVETECEVVG